MTMAADLTPFEARMSAQERKTTILTTRIEDLSQGVEASYKQILDYLILIETRLDKIEATMATKQDIADVRADMTSMEGRLLGRILDIRTDIASREQHVLEVFKELVMMVDPRRTSQ